MNEINKNVVSQWLVLIIIAGIGSFFYKPLFFIAIIAGLVFLFLGKISKNEKDPSKPDNFGKIILFGFNVLIIVFIMAWVHKIGVYYVFLSPILLLFQITLSFLSFLLFFRYNFFVFFLVLGSLFFLTEMLSLGNNGIIFVTIFSGTLQELFTGLDFSNISMRQVGIAYFFISLVGFLTFEYIKKRPRKNIKEDYSI